jgi:hypothetical protein
LVIGSLVAKAVELVDDFHFLAALGPVGDVEDLGEVEGAGTSDQVADTVLFGDVVEE